MDKAPSKRNRRLVLAVLALVTAAWLVARPGPPSPVAASEAAPAQDVAADFAKDIRPLLEKYCFRCHGARQPKADVKLAAFADEALAAKAPKLWKKVRDQLHSREMPPDDQPQPTPAERECLTDWVELLLKSPAVAGARDPGRVVPRRLTRVEYARTICDLVPSMRAVYYPLANLEGYYDPAKGFPADGVTQMHWIGPILTTNLRTPIIALPPDDVEDGFENNGEALTLSPLLLHKYLATATEVLDVAKSKKDARVFVARPGPNQNGRQAAREIIAAFAPRAFRRSVAAEEIDRYLRLFDAADRRGDAFEDSVKVPLQAILVSPHFLFRVEREPGPAGANGVRPVGDYELASRLSYFLWSTMPDDELLELAKKGELREPRHLERQVRRMLRSPKSKALADNFATQWLRLPLFETAAADPEFFPQFSSVDESVALRFPIGFEPLLFTEIMLMEDRSVLEFIDADWAVWSRPLAQFYGLAGTDKVERADAAGWRWKRYRLTDRRRGGVLTMAAVLTQTSSPARTSPVKRGKWILETILGAPPPPPLPNAGAIKEDAGPPGGATFRQVLEKHRRDAECASCHKKMDPLGFGLENYDPIGAWRQTEWDTIETTWRFRRDGDLQGWKVLEGWKESAAVKAEVKGGSLGVTLAETNQNRSLVLHSPRLLKTTAMNQVVVRLKNGTAAQKARASFNGSNNTNGGFGRQLDVDIQPHSDFREYTFDLTQVQPWSGITEGLRLEPVLQVGEGEFRVEWIRIGRSPGGTPSVPVDASGELAGGVTFQGPEELKKILLTRHKNDFMRCLVEHMLTYALGRKLDYYDVPVVEGIGQAVAQDGYKFSTLVLEVVKSYPFLHRRTKETNRD
jgi:hypothetical protein